MVRNEARMASRATRRRRRRETRAAEIKDQWFQAPGDNSDNAARVANAVASLPAEQREIVTARIWGGLGFREIGSLIGISPSSAHRRYQEGLQNLREKMDIPCKKQT